MSTAATLCETTNVRLTAIEQDARGVVNLDQDEASLEAQMKTLAAELEKHRAAVKKEAQGAIGDIELSGGTGAD